MKQMLEQTEILPQLPSFESFFQVYEQINKALWSDYHSKKITKQNLIVERFSRSFQEFGLTGRDWQDLNRQYLENMALQTELFRGTLETLIALKGKGYRMHIITNGFSEVQRAKLINCGLDGFFPKVFISEEVQTTKPHRQIFEHALKSVNASKKESIMIGDSWEVDIEGALEFGIDQVMFLNHGLHSIPMAVELIKLPEKSLYLEIKPKIRTYFINEIPDLLSIF